MLEELFELTGCVYFSDLKYADEAIKTKLALIIEAQYPVEAVSLWEWNDALNYLSGSTPEATSKAAREKLLQLLQNSI